MEIIAESRAGVETCGAERSLDTNFVLVRLNLVRDGLQRLEVVDIFGGLHR